MDNCFLLLGTNLGDRTHHLSEARQHIESSIGTIQTSSGVYETAPWGIEDQPHFLNQVLNIHTTKTPEQVMETIFSIEIAMGRERVIKWGTRAIDIDILYYNDKIINKDNLQIPHPEIDKRRFTLVPLVEIAPDFIHPEKKLTQKEMLERCTDPLEVKQIDQ